MNRIIRLTSWVILLLGVSVLMGFINYNLNEEKCREIVVEITDMNLFGFVSESDIVEILNREFHTPISQKIADISCHDIECRLNQHPSIERADAFISIDRKLHIRLRQRKPILRVYSGKSSYYLDNNGKVMPLSKKYTAHVPIASGNISIPYSMLDSTVNNSIHHLDSTRVPELYFDLLRLAQFLENHKFWNAQIEQVYVDKESEFELIPRVGNHSIVLGGVDNLEKKFRKLMIFYKKGLSKTGWNEYETINLKFENQVVCTKQRY